MVERYNFECESVCCKTQDENGRWVKYTDWVVMFTKRIGYDKLASSLSMENKELKEKLDKVCFYYGLDPEEIDIL